VVEAKGSALIGTDLVAQLRKQLEPDGRSWVKLNTLVERAGRERGSPELRAQIQQALAEAGIYHAPIDLQSCPSDDTVLISTTPIYDRGLPFQNEKELSVFIARHYRLLRPFRHCTSVEREFRLGNLKADLFLREANGDRIVCELEHSTGGWETGSQIIGYVEAAQKWAKEQAMTRTPEIRGVVITGAPNPGQEAMVADWCKRHSETISWYYYKLELELVPSEFGLA
jgi:hypothetical protein